MAHWAFLLLESLSLVTLLPFVEVECETASSVKNTCGFHFPKMGAPVLKELNRGSQCGWLGLLHSVRYNLHILSSMHQVHFPCTHSSFDSLSWKFSVSFKLKIISIQLNSVHFSHSVMSDSLLSHELQHSRPLCPSPTPGV